MFFAENEWRITATEPYQEELIAFIFFIRFLSLPLCLLRINFFLYHYVVSKIINLKSNQMDFIGLRLAYRLM